MSMQTQTIEVKNTYCQRCNAGLTGSPLAKLKNFNSQHFDNIVVCDVCGSPYAMTNGQPEFYYEIISRYREPLLNRVEDYTERNEAKLRPLIIPLTWSFAQIVVPDLPDYRFPIVTTPMSLLYTYSMSALSVAVGGRVYIGVPMDVEKAFKEQCKQLTSEIRKATTQNILFVTDILEDNMISGYDPVNLTILCIRDGRKEKDQRRSNVPRVFEITSERIKYR